MATHVIREEVEMATVAEAVLEVLPQKKEAQVIALRGDLGAGKTAFTQALARVLGITEHVTSPTFVIMKSYPVSAHEWIHELIHIDAYRVEDTDEMRVLKLTELYEKEGAVICIEWPEKIRELVPATALMIDITLNADSTRTITYES